MATERAQGVPKLELIAGGREGDEEVDLDAEDFLELVWGDRQGWVDLPAKVAGNWVPFYFEWPAGGECPAVVTRRIDSCLRDGEDLYFSVSQFSERGRDPDEAKSSRWLWADLDEVHPAEAAKIGVTPTIAWESSQGRYQALWALNQRVRGETLEKLNRALTYHLGADSGGWDTGQVLRLPGTRNFKYSEAPMVRVLWHYPALAHDPRRVWHEVRSSHRGSALSTGQGLRDGPRKPAPVRVRALLRVPADSVVEGERSARLWEIECLLAEAGWGEDDIYEVVSASAWNKWARVRTGERRLRREIRKAIAHVVAKKARSLRESESGAPTEVLGEDGATLEPGTGDVREADGVAASPFVRYASFMAMDLEAPRWLVEGIWTAASHGIVGGEPKTHKSTMMLALGLSIASGIPFLGKYPVHSRGPVLMIQEENSPWVMQDRMRKIAASYGLIGKRDVMDSAPLKGHIAKRQLELRFPTDLPFRLLNNWGFDLGDEDHRQLLIREIEVVKPAMVILDPMYLILPNVNTDKLQDIQPFLKWLLQVRYEYEVAMVIVHHFRKAPTGAGAAQVRAGQRVLGSTTFHGWAESALYMSAMGDGTDGKVMMEREYRNVAPEKPLELQVQSGKPGSLDFDVTVRGFDVAGQLESLIATDPGITANQAAEVLGVDKRTVLTRARGSEHIRLEKGKQGRGHSHRLYLQEKTHASQEA